ncbi:MAG: Smr/MutS family protein [Bacteroidales bacterium]|jgi:DNA mismatch repair protein MutS2|nr:Smr/MutS family protein [Bacteroidales bacterium]
MDDRIEHKLGFNQVRSDIKERCIGDGGKKLVDKMKFLNDYAAVEYQLKLTDEFRNIIMSNQNFPCENYFDVTAELLRLRLEGTFIDRLSLFDLQRSLHTIADCISFLDEGKEQYENLVGLCLGLEVDKKLLKRCDMLLDSDGEFFDDASYMLKEIRSKRKRKTIEIDKRIRHLLVASKHEGWTDEDAEITIRNGRQVIPVSTANKRRIKGFVHDYSSSGNTSYIEPSEVVELYNEVRELDFEQEKEIIRILTEFTEQLREHIGMLIEDYRFLSQIDFIRAKALYAVKIKAGRPILDKQPKIYWFEARHPLLQANLAAHHKDIVPLKVELNEQRRILIISGPNAGGKSVCLKTIGLLQYMLQCGLLVPMRETSEAGIFGNIFIDIGDEQSLENDLSTYSSHLLNMKQLCSQASGRTLFLIDEFGSGTDPQIGGAIAEAIIEDLVSKKAFGVITSHYSNLKLLADKPSGRGSVINGAMLFDLKQMKPLYVLSIGKPGSSFAFEIAKSIGLPQSIIDRAISKTGIGIMNYEQQLQQIEVDKQDLKRKQEQFKMTDNLLAETIAKYEKLSLELQNKKSGILFEARQEAKQILEGANQRIEKAISDIRATNADKEQTNVARNEIEQQLQQVKQELDIEKTPVHKSKKAAPTEEISFRFDNTAVGEDDYVLLNNSRNVAKVVWVKRNKVEVLCGNITMTLPLDEVKKIDKTSYLKYEKAHRKNEKSFYCSSTNSIMTDINKKRAMFKYQIDLRGEKAEQALKLVAKQIDEARLLGEREFAVLHGKGDGILKTVIRNYLRTCVEVISFRPAALESGGEGITIVTLN